LKADVSSAEAVGKVGLPGGECLRFELPDSTWKGPGSMILAIEKLRRLPPPPLTAGELFSDDVDCSHVVCADVGDSLPAITNGCIESFCNTTKVLHQTQQFNSCIFALGHFNLAVLKTENYIKPTLINQKFLSSYFCVLVVVILEVRRLSVLKIGVF